MSNIELVGEWQQLEFVINESETSAAPYGPVQRGSETVMVCAASELDEAKEQLMSKSCMYVLDQMEYFNRGFNLWVRRFNTMSGPSRCCGCEYSETCTVKE